MAGPFWRSKNFEFQAHPLSTSKGHWSWILNNAIFEVGVIATENPHCTISKPLIYPKGYPIPPKNTIQSDQHTLLHQQYSSPPPPKKTPLQGSTLGASSASPSPSNPPPPSVSDTAAVRPDPHQARPGAVKKHGKTHPFSFAETERFFQKTSNFIWKLWEVSTCTNIIKYDQMSILWPYWWNIFRYCAFLQVNNNYQRTQPFPWLLPLKIHSEVMFMLGSSGECISGDWIPHIRKNLHVQSVPIQITPLLSKRIKNKQINTHHNPKLSCLCP